MDISGAARFFRFQTKNHAKSAIAPKKIAYRVLRNFKSAKNAVRNASKSKKVYGLGKCGFGAMAGRFYASMGFLEIDLTGKNGVFLISTRFYKIFKAFCGLENHTARKF
jgi:hypothetical protein